MLTCATGAWAGYASGTVNIITSDTDGTAADGYKYEDVTIGDSATYPSDLELGYGNTSNPPKLNKSYIYLFNATGDTNGSNKNTTLNLGNGFTATVTLPSDDNGTTTLKITGTPNKTGKVSFRVGRFDSTSPSNNTSAKGVSTLIITVKNAPSTKAPTITKKTNPSEATHGKKFYFTIEASNNVDPSEESTTGYSNVTIYDDEDKTNGVLSAAELKALFEITATNSGDGTLILEADKLQAPTSVDITGGIKLIAQVSNDYTYGVTFNNEQAAEDGIEEDYVVTQTYTLKINPIAPKIEAVYVDGKKFTKTDFVDNSQ